MPLRAYAIALNIRRYPKKFRNKRNMTDLINSAQMKSIPGTGEQVADDIQ